MAVSIDTARLDQRIAGVAAEIQSCLAGKVAISVRSDALRMRSYGCDFFFGDRSTRECPIFRGARYPGEWRATDRSMWNHRFRPEPWFSPQSFLERYDLPDADANEWAADFEYRWMANLPLVFGDQMFGKMTVFTSRTLPAGWWGEPTLRKHLAEFTPLWIARQFLRDVEIQATETLSSSCAHEAMRRVHWSGALGSPVLGSVLAGPEVAALRDFGGRAGWEAGGRAVRIVFGLGDSSTHRGLAAILQDTGWPAGISGDPIAFANTLVDALVSEARWQPDVVIVDVRTALGLEYLHSRLNRGLPATPVALVHAPSERLVAQIGEFGVSACLDIAHAHSELAAAVAAAIQGRAFSGSGVRDLVGLATRREKLTPRELEALRTAAAGASSGEIAARLAISERTANFHLQNAYRKLGAPLRVSAIQIARHAGLI